MGQSYSTVGGKDDTVEDKKPVHGYGNGTSGNMGETGSLFKKNSSTMYGSQTAKTPPTPTETKVTENQKDFKENNNSSSKK